MDRADITSWAEQLFGVPAAQIVSIDIAPDEHVTAMILTRRPLTGVQVADQLRQLGLPDVARMGFADDPVQGVTLDHNGVRIQVIHSYDVDIDDER